MKITLPDGKLIDQVSAFSYHIVSRHVQDVWPAQLFKVRHHVGEDALDEFMRLLFQDGDVIRDLIFTTNKPMIMTPKDVEKFKATSDCHICRKKINHGEKKVRDHDHFTGRFRGAAHEACNSKYTSKLKDKQFNIPVVFHNGRGYDFYHVMQGVKKHLSEIDKLEVTAVNMEKFRAINFRSFRFIDSMQFVNGSLEKQVENLVKETLKKDRPKVFKPVLAYLQQMAKKILVKSTRSQRNQWALRTLDICTSKGIYPYEWADSFEKMKEQSLPGKKEFFSALRNEGISDEDYTKAKKAWKCFGCKNFGEYTRIYCDLDVLLLEVIFELFRDGSINDVRLDPAHFITAPSLSWSAMLLMNHAKDMVIENMTDVDMFLMVEGAIRGGMCQVLSPYSKSYPMTQEEVWMEDGEDELGGEVYTKEDEDYIGLRDIRFLYLDANNLYGWAMMEMLPEGDYAWERWGDDMSNSETLLTETTKRNRQLGPIRRGFDAKKEWAEQDVDKLVEYILSINPNDKRGYILEVDIHANPECHDELNNYPMLPEKKRVTPSMFTRLQTKAINEDSVASKAEKLVLDLTPKTNYVIHLQNLQQALQRDAKGNRRYIVTRVGKVISFRQSAWLADYINFNTDKRKLAKNPIEKDFWKLLNNSLFGKTMEQVRKRRNIQFFMKDNLLRAVRQASTPYVKGWRVLAKDELLMMEMAKHEVVMDRPMIIGFCILEHSKRRMFDFFYNEFKPYFSDEEVTVLYTDTDSLVIEIRAKPGHTVNETLVKMQKEINCFDCSEFVNKDHPLITNFTAEEIKKNAKVPGKFKDELGGRDGDEFIALRAKMYYIRMFDPNDDKHRAKGIPEKAVIVDDEKDKEKDTKEKKGRALGYDDYIKALEGGGVDRVTFQTFTRTKDYIIHSKTVEKIGLTAADDKSHYFDSMRSLRYGHKRIKEIEWQKLKDNLSLNDWEESDRMGDIDLSRLEPEEIELLEEYEDKCRTQDIMDEMEAERQEEEALQQTLHDDYMEAMQMEEDGFRNMALMETSDELAALEREQAYHAMDVDG